MFLKKPKKKQTSKPVAPKATTKDADKNPLLEESLVLLKPDCVQRKLAGQVIKRIESSGFKPTSAKLVRPKKQMLERHYKDLNKKPFFGELIRYMTSGPILAMAWQGLDVIKTLRDIVGATNPAQAEPGTIRGDFCVDVGRNLIHASDSVGAAQQEIGLWFPEGTCAWNAVAIPWIYEDCEEGDGAELTRVLCCSVMW